MMEISRKAVSLINGLLFTWKGLVIAMHPTTTHVMNIAAPTSSPMAKLGESIFIASKVEKTSGLPLPNANNVTPAKLSLILKIFAKVSKLGHRNSDAVIPNVVNNMINVRT
ncbi:hypothetical protein WICPIJ_000029 [Wickerhamomyces pijperi]|uniref:Uncharacterized protein n=1 Tax=Wickerhamomyces pijperi TaxID=599730 RepID=A0A9P8TSG1_WICPI|nr:hypothetical protein WICPIJ_000029 [Wickerhamomyces pijperi]